MKESIYGLRMIGFIVVHYGLKSKLSQHILFFLVCMKVILIEDIPLC